jgi:hypothetical protein
MQTNTQDYKKGIVICLIIFVFTSYFAFHKWQFVQKATITNGTVIESQGAHFDVEFRLPNNEQVIYSESSRFTYKLGDKVELLYLASDPFFPKSTSINKTEELYGSHFILMIVSTVFVLLFRYGIYYEKKKQ